MSNSFRIVLFACGDLEDFKKNSIMVIDQTSDLKELVRLLIDNDIDAIVVGNKQVDYGKLEKIYRSYHVPFVFLGKVPDKVLKGSYVSLNTEGQLHNYFSGDCERIASHRIQRENKKLIHVMDKMTAFNNCVIQTDKDSFVSEINGFFADQFDVQSTHWVEVKSLSSKLPPILRLKQELEKQKVNQSVLISDLDSCSIEIMSTEGYQIWKTNEGNYFTMIWLTQGRGTYQCLILNKIKFKKLTKFELFLEHFHAALSRRWSLCLVTEENRLEVFQDSLTCLYNQRYLNEVLEKKITENQRYSTPFSVLFIDVDHFKRVNDSLGHVVGSSSLAKLAALLKEQIRTSDYAFRYGGDEFIILLSHTEGTDAEYVAERIRKSVEDTVFQVEGIGVRITVSIGLACFPKHAKSAKEIVRIADEAMYYGKHKSRNIVYKAS